MGKIGAIIVTFNRIQKLKNTLKYYDAQSDYLEFVLVYNNCSNDGTEEFLEEWKNENGGFTKIVVNGKKNIGGAGGFHEAMRLSMNYDYDWLWISDDDAYPLEGSFHILKKYTNNVDEKVGAICGAVYEHNDIAFAHRCIYKSNRYKAPFGVPANRDYYNKKSFLINIYSFVGTAVSKTALKKCGYPKKEYFIWCDDAEHSMRINKLYKIICVPSIKILHDVEPENKTISWKSYYGVRNQLDAMRSNGSLLQTLVLYLMYTKSLFIAKQSDLKKYQVIKKALYDFRHKNLGVSSTYYPGCKL